MTTIEVTLKIFVNNKTAAVDENSIKGAINIGMNAIAEANFQCIDDNPPESVSVTITKLKQSGRLVDLGAFGTPELPWGEA
jgi:hypothetical protein